MPAPTSPRRMVSVRALVASLIITALISTGGAVAVSYIVIGHAPPGPRGAQGLRGDIGPRGPRGARGRSGTVEVDDEAVWNAIELDPQRLDQDLEPAPADVQDDVDSLRSDVEAMCSSIQDSDVFFDSTDIIDCP